MLNRKLNSDQNTGFRMYVPSKFQEINTLLKGSILMAKVILPKLERGNLV